MIVSFITWILNLLDYWVFSEGRNKLGSHCTKNITEVLKKHIVTHAGLKTDAKKHGFLQSNLSFVDWQRLPKEAKSSQLTHEYSGKKKDCFFRKFIQFYKVCIMIYYC